LIYYLCILTVKSVHHAGTAKTPQGQLSRAGVDKQSYYSPALSLGEGGLFVSTRYLLNPTSEINVEFSLGRDTIRTRAQVRHGQNSIGMGMMFINRTALQCELIKKYVVSMSSEGTDLDKRKILMIDPDPLKRRIYGASSSATGSSYSSPETKWRSSAPCRSETSISHSWTFT